MSPHRTVTRALCAALLASPGLAHAQSDRDTSFAIPRNGVIDISLTSGRIEVRGTDRATAELRARGNNYRLNASGVSVTLAVPSTREQRGDSRSRSSRSAPDIELLVPRSVRVILHGRNADLTASDLSGDVEAHVLTGDISLSAIDGRAFVETLSGDVDVDGVGDLRVTTVSGDISARGVRGAIDASSTSGDVTLQGERVPRMQVDGVSSEIRFEGTLATDARVQVTTHSGDVFFRLPASAGGELEVSTFNGDVVGGTMTLLPSTGTMRRGLVDRSSRRFEFGGGGGIRLVISTFNGDVTLQRDGRSRPD